MKHYIDILNKVYAFNVEGDQDDLIEQGFKPVTLPDTDVSTWIVDYDSGEIRVDEQKALSLARNSATRRINAARDAALADGLQYTMPDGTNDVIQMQAGDRQNLMGLAIDARDLMAAGETGAVHEFRGRSNARHWLTPAQMIDLTNAALAHYKGVMAQSWDRKDAIEAVELSDYPSLDEAVAAIEGIGWE
ncbi:DUF4376 domain-containing protein [Halomonas sp. EF61]|uniref:DUF4376 domain-containing protein n=1 Tax=Halomonas sp. EF61 TaxID=2950869 RepID=UPI0032DF276A